MSVTMISGTVSAYREKRSGTMTRTVMGAPILLLPMFRAGAFAGFIFVVMAGPLFTLGGIWLWFKRVPVVAAWQMVQTAPRTIPAEPSSGS